MRQANFGVAILAAALALVAPRVARAQAFNPAQAAGIAQGVIGLMFHAMNPTPACGPGDNWGHPYQQRLPYYNHTQPAQPPPLQPRNFSDDDDDDDDIQPVQRHAVRHPGAYSNQRETRPDLDQDDAGQPAEASASRDEETQPQTIARRQPAQSNHGQIVEIPSLRSGAQGSQPQRAGSQPSESYDFATGQ